MNKKSIWIAVVAIIALGSMCVVALSTSALGAEKQKKKKYAINISSVEFAARIADFENATNWEYLGDRPSIVDFYADWCGPCRKLSPVMEALAEKYDGKIHIYKVNVDKNPDLASAFGISSIPAMLFIPMDGEPQMIMGYRTKEQLDLIISDLLLPR